MAWFCIQGVRQYGEKGLRFDVSLFRCAGIFCCLYHYAECHILAAHVCLFLWEGVRENEMKSQLEFQMVGNFMV